VGHYACSHAFSNNPAPFRLSIHTSDLSPFRLSVCLRAQVEWGLWKGAYLHCAFHSYQKSRPAGENEVSLLVKESVPWVRLICGFLSLLLRTTPTMKVYLNTVCGCFISFYKTAENPHTLPVAELYF
jgi:hypothetical protein